MTTTPTQEAGTHSRSEYEAFQATAQQLTRIIRNAVITPVAKQHFEDDRGYPVTQELPDRSTEYTFVSHGFDALVLPDERRVVNECYHGNRITPSGITRDIESFSEILEDAESLWVDTFGEYTPHVTQRGHPGPFPLSDSSVTASIKSLQSMFESLRHATNLETVTEIVRDSNYPLLADVFGTQESDILTPGGTDLSAVTGVDEIHVPYNDGEIAVLRPVSQRAISGNAVRGVIIGHDDTPTGIFAHVTDVTNLDPEQPTTYEAIHDAMGFDEELDPWDLPDRLEAPPETRIRLQGDLRVERTTDVEGFPSEIARHTRLTQYEEMIESVIEPVELPEEFVRWQDNSVPLGSVVEYTVDPSNGSVTIETTTTDDRLSLFAYTTALTNIEFGPASMYDSYDDIPYVREPDVRRFGLAIGNRTVALGKARREFRKSLEAVTNARQSRVETAAKEAAKQVDESISVPRQVNLPVDNHMTFVESGFAPDVDTEPIPVAVPEETTLHIVHGEHNTVTMQIDPGVYRFSLLPRGLQPVNDRPEWPRK